MSVILMIFLGFIVLMGILSLVGAIAFNAVKLLIFAGLSYFIVHVGVSILSALFEKFTNDSDNFFQRLSVDKKKMDIITIILTVIFFFR